MTFRTRLFLTSLATAALTLVVAAVLISWSVRRTMGDRIERSLISQTRLAAETLSHRQAASGAELDGEADALGGLVGARVTLVASDGVVIGDSDLDGEALAAVENHGNRPEIEQARREGLGISRRYSTTVRTDLLYVAVPVNNPALPGLGFVRLALPLTDVAEQLAAVRRIALVAFAVGLVAALAVAWIDVHAGQPSRPGHRRGRGTVCARRLVASGARLRKRRDWHGRARPGRLGA